MWEYIDTSYNIHHKTTQDMVLYNLGADACKAGYRYGPRICPYHLIHFVVEGRGRLTINGSVFEAGPGDAFLIPAEQVAVYQADEQDPWSYAWVGFLGLSSRNYLSRLMESSPEHYLLHGLDCRRYRRRIEYARSYDRREISSYLFANSLLLQILAELFRDLGYKRELQARSALAEDIRYYLDMKYSEKLTMQEVARSFGIHPNYLTQLFRENFSLSPKQYLTKVKLENAAKMLSRTDLPVGTISDALGFEDQMSFSRAFKKYYRLSPSSYRRGAESRDPAEPDSREQTVTLLPGT